MNYEIEAPPPPSPPLRRADVSPGTARSTHERLVARSLVVGRFTAVGGLEVLSPLHGDTCEVGPAPARGSGSRRGALGRAALLRTALLRTALLRTALLHAVLLVSQSEARSATPP